MFSNANTEFGLIENIISLDTELVSFDNKFVYHYNNLSMQFCNLFHFSTQFSGSKCDILLYSSTSKNGTIQSPQYPGAYPPKTFCRYEFLGKVKERIQVNDCYTLGIDLCKIYNL
jgi:hypothetical protein